MDRSILQREFLRSGADLARRPDVSRTGRQTKAEAPCTAEPLEALEARRHFSVTAAVVSNVLVVTGSASADNIYIYQTNGTPDTVYVDDGDGVPEYSFADNLFNKIKVAGGGGAD